MAATIATAPVLTDALIQSNSDRQEHIGNLNAQWMTDVVMPERNSRELAKELLPLFMFGYAANVIAHRGALGDA